MENNFEKNFGHNSKIFSVLALILGICSMICSCEWYIGGIFAICSIALFIISRCVNHCFDGLMIGGLICAVIGLILSVICLLSQTVFIEQFQELYYSLLEKLI